MAEVKLLKSSPSQSNDFMMSGTFGGVLTHDLTETISPFHHVKDKSVGPESFEGLSDLGANNDPKQTQPLGNL